MKDRSKDIVPVSVWGNKLYGKKKKMGKRYKEYSEKTDIYLIDVSEKREKWGRK